MKNLEITLSENYLTKYKKMIARHHIFFVILFMPSASKAQHNTEHTNVIWAGYNNTIRFTKNWSLVSDVQLRTKDWADKWLLYDVRSGLSYNINEKITVTGGLALFRNAQYESKQFFFKNEWRPWEEISYQLKLKKINLIQRLRTEQRFLQKVVNNKKTDNYQYIFRLRYRFELQFPLKENTINLLAGNEVMVNPGYINNTLFFDQNRTSAGINFKLNSNSGLQAQYVKIFQWHSNTSILEDQNVYRINFIQQFNFRKKKKKK